MTEKNLLLKKRVAIITNNLHCERHSQYFSTIEKYFVLNGWIIAEDFNVNKIVICGCGFHDAMYEKIARTLKEIKELNFLEKNIIVMACLPKTHEQDLKRDFSVQIVNLHHEEVLDNIIEAKIPFKDIPPVNIYKPHKKCLRVTPGNEFFHIKISQGCLRECTFCVINKAKGYIKSVPFDQIEEQVGIAIESGRKKIFLMGEDTFAYGIDIGTTIIRLVENLLSIEPTLELYFGYLHIRWLKKYAREIIDLCKRNVFKELAIGLQHVNEDMLKKMGRPAVFSEIYDIICSIKKEKPDFYIICDILVGFPGETEKMFNELIEFFKKDKCINKVKHFGYSDVKGAPASGFKNKLSADEIADRWDRLDKVLAERSYSNHEVESRLDNETFRITRFDDYSFCKNTFAEEINRPTASQDLAMAKIDILKAEKGDFKF